ncbi:MAG: hypothetical protein COB73_00855 [Flavobacteriaceae bacterium]|nr:MAG: hypothetical protein COB73_00855 [Flavobacteriaceae bacterium]
MKKPTETTVRVTPRSVIFLALGGYKNPDAKEKAIAVEKALCNFMTKHNQELVLIRNQDQNSIKFLGKNE